VGFATQFECDVGDVVGGAFHHLASDFGRPRKCEFSDTTVVREWFTSVGTEPGDDVDDTVRDHVVGLFHQFQHRQRRFLGRFEHNRVASRQRRAEFPSGHQQWEVPRDDLADDAVGLFNGLDVSTVVSVDRPSLVGASDTREVPEVVCDEVNIDASLGDRFAVVERFEAGELLCFVLDTVGNRFEHRLSFGARIRAIHLVVGLPRRVDGPINILRTTGLHLGERFAGCWIDCLERLAGGTLTHSPPM